MDKALKTRLVIVPCTQSTRPETLELITMYDRRSPAWDSVEWVLQSSLERLLYKNQETNGSFYRSARHPTSLEVLSHHTVYITCLFPGC